MRKFAAVAVGLVVWLVFLLLAEVAIPLLAGISQTSLMTNALTAFAGSVLGTIFAAMAAGKIAPEWSAQTFHSALFCVALVLLGAVVLLGRDPAEGWSRALVFLSCSTLPILQGLRGQRGRPLSKMQA